jgi:hypothetical protein
VVRNSERLNAVAGIAAVSAVIAMILILSNLAVLEPLVSEIVRQLPAWEGNPDQLFNQLARIRVQIPDMYEVAALVAIAAFLTLSLTSTYAASKIAR